MSDFKNILRQEIITPAKKMIDDGTKVEAVVISINYHSNICSVELTNRDGNKEVKKAVPVRRYTKGIIGWFPEVGDEVILEKLGNRFEIIAQSSRNFFKDNKSKTILTKDILSGLMDDGIGGSIF